MGGTDFICIRVSSNWVIRTSYKLKKDMDYIVVVDYKLLQN